MLSLGVEEEFFLADHASRALTACAPVVVKRARDLLGDGVTVELFPTMVEIRTRPVLTLTELAAELRRVRAGVVAAAREAGCRVVASGTILLPPPVLPEVSEQDRYLRLAAQFAPLVVGDQGAAVCGCHIHLGVADRDEAVRLAGHLRPWLPTLQALAANSPYFRGRDSGYASWRVMRWGNWPEAGPTPLVPDAAAYDALVDTLVRSRMLIDRRMVYWYARPSEHVPTLEIRVADVNSDPDTVLLLAGLLRGLAVVLLAEIRRGVAAPVLVEPVLRAAHWLAAKDGLCGSALDPVTGTLLPADEAVERLMDRAAPGLAAAGDEQRVAELWERLRATGDGATRQRAAFRWRGELRDVVDLLTLPEEPA
ncbi:glutamate--cysteine ligase [Kitasatospora sp. NPDC052896]|uniref:glutamate--cysteine ligase n=1 Tax=Kitasatospora sp. NPDC052896 TaxID=3364061 RepID=UPI0037CC4392